ncbi:MAG: hypothetical protein OHK0031_13450 [Anaerolineales bacterium]
MKKNLRQLLYLVSLFALIFAGTGITPAAAQQAAAPETPLFSGLTWQDAAPLAQDLGLQGQTAPLAGTLFAAKEPFNIDDDANGVAEYYSSLNLEKMGWKQTGISRAEDGLALMYFNEQGYFLTVEFKVCGESSSIVCLKVWQSEATSLKPTIAAANAVTPNAATFNKQTPANGATNLALAGIGISWTAYTGGSLNRYRYCYDTSNDNACDTSTGAAGWTSVWSGTSATLPTLSASKTYYWHVQAVLNDNSKIDSDNGAYWAFSTIALATFGKTSPANNATNQTSTITLAWQSSPSATGGYRYCISEATISCTVWNYNATTSINIALQPGKTYQWQVRAYDGANGTGNFIEADNATWWKFTTTSVPDFSKLAPANNVLNQSIFITLSWQANSGATGGYKYCIAPEGVSCTNWVSTTQTSVQIPVKPSTAYLWQVRAYNTSGGYSEANGGAYWKFSTGAVPGFTQLFLPFIKR